MMSNHVSNGQSEQSQSEEDCEEEPLMITICLLQMTKRIII